MVLKEEFLENLEPTIKGYLESKGYFDSKVEIKKLKDRVYIYIKEGEPVRVVDIKIDTDFDLDGIINWKKGEIFSTDKFDEIKSKINKRLLESGYCNPKVETKAYVDLKNHSAKLKYSIKKGKLCFFGDINIDKKPNDIKKEVILSRIKYKRGDIFDIRKIEDSYNSLNALDTFANVQIKYDLDKKSRYVDSNVSLEKRKKLRRYLIALGVDTEVGFRARGLWEKRNF